MPRPPHHALPLLPLSEPRLRTTPSPSGPRTSQWRSGNLVLDVLSGSRFRFLRFPYSFARKLRLRATIPTLPPLPTYSSLPTLPTNSPLPTLLPSKPCPRHFRALSQWEWKLDLLGLVEYERCNKTNCLLYRNWARNSNSLRSGSRNT